MSAIKCLRCGKPVRLRTARNIVPRGFSMNYIDPTGFFCTMRCAAYYGVWAAKLVKGSK